MLKLLFCSWVQAVRLVLRFSIVPYSERISKSHSLERILAWIEVHLLQFVIFEMHLLVNRWFGHNFHESKHFFDPVNLLFDGS